MISTIQPNEFKLAITMAGAASAGCYTGGVMDYIFEVLDLWERAKHDIENNLTNNTSKAPELEGVHEKIPLHKVVIEAMGGTSAGGMTSTMSAIYALNGKINPIKSAGRVAQWKNNLFYDSWVIMDDLDTKDPRDTFQKLWDTDDMKDGLVHSLLNSSFIDNIADRLFDFKHDLATQISKLPSYFSQDLQMILSHCLLRGMPLDVNFETPIAKTGRKSVIPNHTTYEHYIVSHYHLNNGACPIPSQYLWLNPYDGPNAETLKLATKATGAFPAGLAYREFTTKNFNDSFLKNSLKRIIKGEMGNPLPDPNDSIKLPYFDKEFSSLTVDGGAINNEPYREVNCLLKDKYGIAANTDYPQFGVVMIDPFPDRAQSAAEYERPDDMVGVLPDIIGALTDQSRVKRREVLESDSQTSFRSIIFPSKWKKTGELNKNGKPAVRRDPKPIACSTAMAFGGMLDISFRQHDFFLGRNNARNFLRFFFSFPYDKAKKIVHPIHEQWSDDMISTFLIEKEVEGEMQYFLPIIPDLNMLIEKKTARTADPYIYDIAEMPKYNPNKLFDAEPVMKKRFSTMINVLSKRGNEIGKLTKIRNIEKLRVVDLDIIELQSDIERVTVSENDENLQSKLERMNQKLVKLVQRRNLLNDIIEGVTPATEAGKWLNKKFGQSWFTRNVIVRIKSVFIGLVISIAKPAAASAITQAAIKKVLLDLESNKCLQPFNKK